MIYYLRFAIVVCLLGNLCSGCASIMCGAEKTVNISSEPMGAEFEIIASHYQDTNPPGRRLVKGPDKIIIQGITPTNVSLKRGRGYFQAGDYTVRFHKSGYDDLTVGISQGFETGWYFGGNFVFGGFLGWFIIDPLTGGMWDIKDLHIWLVPSASAFGLAEWDYHQAYQGHINPLTGKMEVSPRARAKVDDKGEPVTDKDGNFIFESVPEK
jgi:hypothetical protein